MRDLGSDVVTECPCCNDNLFEMIDSYFNDDGYEAKWQCQNCGAIWVEQFTLTNTMLLKDGIKQ